jgi:hypothetical protein
LDMCFCFCFGDVFLLYSPEKKETYFSCSCSVVVFFNLIYNYKIEMNRHRIRILYVADCSKPGCNADISWKYIMSY